VEANQIVRTDVMNTTASVNVVGNPKLADRAIARLHQLEQRWSRFLDSSELSRLNRAGGAATAVSADTVALVEAMVVGWHLTNGAFDPTLLKSLVRLGYASSLSDSRMRTSIPPGTKPQGEPANIRVDRDHSLVQLPRGTVLDPGGIGKGLAADIICAESINDGAAGVLVEVGGDARVAGKSPVDSGWTIEIQRPDRSSSSLSIGLLAGAVATSSSRLRRWVSDGVDRHHLLDPATQEQTTGAVVGCTVVAGTAALAEAFTKVGFVTPVDDAMEFLEKAQLAALITTSSGDQYATAAWTDFVR
jgi:thiamine biosynthesis lipoprotein